MAVKSAMAVVVLSLAMVLSSCSSARPEESVRGFLDAVSKGDFQTAAGFVAEEESSRHLDDALKNPDSSKWDEEAVKTLFSRMTYEIASSSHVERDKAKVEASITALDMVRIFGQVMIASLPLAYISHPWPCLWLISLFLTTARYPYGMVV